MEHGPGTPLEARALILRRTHGHGIWMNMAFGVDDSPLEIQGNPLPDVRMKLTRWRCWEPFLKVGKSVSYYSIFFWGGRPLEEVR